MNRHTALTLRDLRDGAMSWHIWGHLAWQDVRLRYRRSMLGPLWLTLSAAIFIGVIGTLYGRFFGQSSTDFVPHLAVGFIVWTLMVQIVNEACVVYIQAENILKQVNLPLTVHIWRMVWRNVLIFLHNFAIVPIVILLAGKPVALALLLWNCFWLAIVLAATCTRFRDVPPIVANVAQLLFFISPIMWTPDFLGNRIWVAHYNPIYHLIELFRAPLLESRIPLTSVAVCIVMGLIGSAFCFALLSRFRHRIAYWL
jgi:lipopolysaccharide transport system permease protein